MLIDDLLPALRPRAPPAAVETGCRLFIAAAFAVISLAAQASSSKKRPWKGEKREIVVVKAFVVSPLPFILLEAATGLASLITGTLSIPLAVGIGTGVDLVILMAGLAVTISRGLKKTPEPE